MSRHRRRCVLASAAGAAMAAVSFSHTLQATPANVLYWDPYPTPNTAVSANANWDNSTANWNTQSNISSATTANQTTWTAYNGTPAGLTLLNTYGAYFSEGATNTSQGVTVQGTQVAGQIVLASGINTFYGNTSGGSQLIIGSQGITSGTTNLFTNTFDASIGTVLISANDNQWSWSGVNKSFFNVNSSVGSMATPGTTMALFLTASINNGNAATMQFNGSLVDGSSGGAMTVSRQFESAGAVILNALNTYSGGTIASAAVLQVGPTGTLGSGPAYIGPGVLQVSQTSNFVLTNYGYNGQTGFLVGPLSGIGIGNTANLIPGTAGAAGVTLPIDPQSSGYIPLASDEPTALNLSAIGNGSMFLGATGTANYTAATFAAPGAGNAYRLGAGAGLLNVSGGSLTDTGTTKNSLVVGEPISIAATTGANSGGFSTAGVNGTGFVNITTAQTYTGGTTVNMNSNLSGSALAAVGTTPFGSTTAAITLNAGLLKINGMVNTATNTVLGDISFNGTAGLKGSVTSPKTITTITIGSATDTAPLTRVNQGVIQISAGGTGTVLGNTSGGALNVIVGNSAAAPAVVNGIVAPYITDANGNFLTYNPTNGFTPDVTTAFAPAGGTAVNVIASGATTLLSGTDANVNSLVLSGGNLNNSSGSNRNINISSGGLSITNALSGTGSSVVNYNIGSAATNSAINLNFGSPEILVSVGPGLNGAILNNTITNTNTNASSPRLTVSGKGNLTLLGTNTYTGLVTVNGPSTLTVNSDLALGNASNNVLLNGGTLSFSANTSTGRTIIIGNNGGLLTGGTNAIENLNGYITTGGAGTSAPFIDFESGAITTFNISNAAATPNDFTAPIYIFGRTTLQVASDSQLGNANNSITFISYVNSSLADYRPTIVATASLTSNRNILTTGSITDGGVLDAKGSGTVFTEGGVISGDSSLTANLTNTYLGTVDLTGTNTYFGTTTVLFGTLEIGNGGTTGTLGQGTVTNNGTLAFNRSSNYAVANLITGTGLLNVVGTGQVALSFANTYTGLTNISAGTLIAANTTGSATGTNKINLIAGTLASSTLGMITGLVQAGTGISTIAPGGIGSIGTLTIGGMNTSSTTTISFDLGNTSTGTVTTGGDLLVLSGASNIASGTAITFGSNPTTAGMDYRLIGDTASGAIVSTLNLTHFTLPAATGVTYSLSTSVDPNFVDLVVTGTGPNNLIFNNANSTTGDGTTFANGSAMGSYQNFENTGAGNAAAYFSAGDNVTFNDGNNGKYNVTIVGTVAPGSTTVSSTGNYNFGGGSIGGLGGLTKTLSGTLTLSSANSYSGATNVSGGSIVLAAAGALPSGTALTIGSSASVVSNKLAATFIVGSLANSGLLDLANNKLVVHSGSLSTLSAETAQGYNLGGWNGGIGIASSAAAADTTHLTALGVIQNSSDGTASGSTLYTSFGSATGLTASDVLEKYTYYGDANLDGKVDGSDYSRIDSGYLAGNFTGWYNGDFNYDGVVDGSDYTLIDNAFNTQGAAISSSLASPLAISTAQIAGSASVPEPTSVGLLSIAALGVLGRRRRRIV